MVMTAEYEIYEIIVSLNLYEIVYIIVSSSSSAQVGRWFSEILCKRLFEMKKLNCFRPELARLCECNNEKWKHSSGCRFMSNSPRCSSFSQGNALSKDLDSLIITKHYSRLSSPHIVLVLIWAQYLGQPLSQAPGSWQLPEFLCGDFKGDKICR